MYANEEQIEFGVPSCQLSYQHQLLQQRKRTALGMLILQCRFITTSTLITAALADTKAKALFFSLAEVAQLRQSFIRDQEQVKNGQCGCSYCGLVFWFQIKEKEKSNGLPMSPVIWLGRNTHLQCPLYGACITDRHILSPFGDFNVAPKKQSFAKGFHGNSLPAPNKQIPIKVQGKLLLIWTKERALLYWRKEAGESALISSRSDHDPMVKYIIAYRKFQFIFLASPAQRIE